MWKSVVKKKRSNTECITCSGTGKKEGVDTGDLSIEELRNSSLACPDCSGYGEIIDEEESEQ